ncbi:MAG: NfeD family protein [Desulfobacteraceae bacterium]|nr:NfeD family protein [Desulfobacteraceae bacterium]
MDKNILIAIILQLAGIGVIIAEIIIPSGGILSILAAGLVGYSLFVVFTSVSAAAGTAFVALDVLLIPVLVIWGLKMLAKSPATLKEELSRKKGYSSQNKDLGSLLNREGIVTTPLRPAGMADIDGKRVDVVSRGEFIPKDTLVVVMEVTGNQVIVGCKE